MATLLLLVLYVLMYSCGGHPFLPFCILTVCMATALLHLCLNSPVCACFYAAFPPAMLRLWVCSVAGLGTGGDTCTVQMGVRMQFRTVRYGSGAAIACSTTHYSCVINVYMTVQRATLSTLNHN